MSETVSVSELQKLVSETRNPRTMDLDRLPVQDLLKRMNAEDQLVALAVQRELPNVALAVERIVDAFSAGGRLIYVGAGTSGRLGVLDASECPPTFSVPAGMVVGLIAGGDTALRNAVEGAEDDEEQGAEDLRRIDLGARDVVVGIAVSGKTPYVAGALAYAKGNGATTVALSCNPASKIAEISDVVISPVVGPEVLTGSTRLKSGTAQKMVLNMLSTASMIRIGKAYENLMVDLSISNRKLKTRAIGIVVEATGCDAQVAEDLLAASGLDVKLAIFMQLAGLERGPAEERLRAAGGFLREAIEETRSQSART